MPIVCCRVVTPPIHRVHWGNTGSPSFHPGLGPSRLLRASTPVSADGFKSLKLNFITTFAGSMTWPLNIEAIIDYQKVEALVVRTPCHHDHASSSATRIAPRSIPQGTSDARQVRPTCV